MLQQSCLEPKEGMLGLYRKMYYTPIDALYPEQRLLMKHMISAESHKLLSPLLCSSE